MIDQITTKNLKYIISGLIFLIILSFFFLNQNYYSQSKNSKGLDEFKIEIKNIHSLLTKKIPNQYNKKKNISRKRSKFKFIITRSRGLSKREI